MSVQYDAIIVGGGMVGAALACLLGQAGKRIAVLETRLPSPFDPLRHAHDDFDLRVSAISRASQRLLEKAGAWEGVLARRAAPYEVMQVWDATGDGSIRFDAADIGEPDLGHIVENRVIQAALFDVLMRNEQIDVHCPVHWQTCARDEQQVRVTLDTGETLTAALLVGADGAHSKVRALMHVNWQPEDYGQKGLVCVAHTELPHQATAWQRFMPSGPLAFLPLPDQQACSVVWSLPADRADRLLKRDEADFRQALASALDYQLGEVTAVSQRAAFPLRGAQAAHYVSERLALIGDAAHTIHPLAGQGVNLGFKDAAALAEHLLSARGDWGSLKVLRRYERSRRGDNALTQKAMEGFKLLFGNTLTPWQVLRNAGLNQMDRLPLLKYEIARRAMGI